MNFERTIQRQPAHQFLAPSRVVQSNSCFTKRIFSDILRQVKNGKDVELSLEFEGKIGIDSSSFIDFNDSFDLNS